MNQQTIFLTMLGMLAVTYIPRLLPVWFLADKSLPKSVITWLRYVPVAVLSALLMPTLLIPNNKFDFSGDNLFLWAAIPTFLVAWKTKSLFLPVIVGMLIIAAARYWG
ncbi:MAG TPA: AzlD domain-containing protein [Anaerolineae bacterium]|nr:AzlD domain-containing protein [Anaerolineae bacterium]